MSTYTVTYERDESGWWFASVAGVPGCHTQGRTIQEAERRIREALGLFVEDAESAELERDVRLPNDVNAAVEEYRRARQRLEETQEKSRVAALKATHALAVNMSLSVRDAGSILELSHQRIQQLKADGSRGTRTRRSKKAAG